MRPGEELERLTRDLLRLGGWNVSSGEELVDYVKVDMLATRWELGKARVMVVECKDYARALTKGQLDRILIEYSTLLNSGSAHQLLVVTRRGISPAAAARIR